MEEQLRLGTFCRSMAKYGDVAVGMETVDEAQAGSGVDAQAQRTCGHAAVGLHLDGRAVAENVRPPRAFGGWSQGRAIISLRFLPGGERSHPQLAMPLKLVAMGAEVGQQNIGALDGGDAIGGEQRGQTVLPVLMTALDFAFGPGRGSVAESDVVEVEGRAELASAPRARWRGRRCGNRRTRAAAGHGRGKRGAGSPGKRGGTRKGRSARRRGAGCSHRAC